jgi:hypothetical protein
MQEWKNKNHMECKDTRHIWQLWKRGEKWCYYLQYCNAKTPWTGQWKHMKVDQKL